MRFIKLLQASDVQKIMDKVNYRQEKFKNEDPLMSLGVVLMNYGDNLVEVECVAKEWRGLKEDLALREGIPLCPNGHPLFELTLAPQLALVEVEENN